MDKKLDSVDGDRTELQESSRWSLCFVRDVAKASLSSRRVNLDDISRLQFSKLGEEILQVCIGEMFLEVADKDTSSLETVFGGVEFLADEVLFTFESSSL